MAKLTFKKQCPDCKSNTFWRTPRKQWMRLIPKMKCYSCNNCECTFLFISLFQRKYYTLKIILNERKEERRKGERRITEKGLLELIEFAVELELNNIIFRSGTYYPSSTRHNTKGKRRLFDRRILLPVKVAGIA